MQDLRSQLKKTQSSLALRAKEHEDVKQAGALKKRLDLEMDITQKVESALKESRREVCQTGEDFRNGLRYLTVSQSL